MTPACTERAVAFYGQALETIVRVSSPDAAELVKLLENIFRSVNIALVNELAQLCDRINVDVWEVVEAASTKPFGFMSFKPGPGLGGHCLPVDPFYLSWKAREFDFYTEFIELAGKVNENMPSFCYQKIVRGLNEHERPLKGSRVHLSASPTRRTSETSASPPRSRWSSCCRPAARSSPTRTSTSRSSPSYGLAVDELEPMVETADCIVIVTAHKGIDYASLSDRARLVMDFRNATGSSGHRNGNVWKL